jgi:hypothetical protein
METPALGYGLSGGAARAGLLTGSAGLARGLGLATRALGKFLLPLMAVMAAFDAWQTPREGGFRQQAWQTIAGVAHGATFGLVPRVTTEGERKSRAVQDILTGAGYYTGGGVRITPGNVAYAAPRHVPNLQAQIDKYGGSFPRTLADLTGQLRATIASQAALRALGTKEARDNAMALNDQTRALRISIQAIEDERRTRAVGISNRRARQLLGQYGTGLEPVESKYGTGAAMGQATDWFLRDVGKLKPEARRILATGILKPAADEVKKHPELANEYQRMTERIVKKFQSLGQEVGIVNGRVVDLSKRSFQRWEGILKTHTERGRKQVSTTFQAIRSEAAQMLTAMGYSPQEAAALVRRAEAGGSLTGQIITPGMNAGQIKTRSEPGMQDWTGGPRIAGGPRGIGGPGGTTTPPPSGVVAIGHWLQGLGYQVGEHPAFGGVAPVHTPTSYHYRGQAIDVNWPNPAQEPAMLDRIFPMLAALHPTELLWRTKGHFDHLHLAVGGGPGSYIAGGLAGALGIGRIPFETPTENGLASLGAATAGTLYGAALRENINKAMFGGWFGDGGQITARRPTLIGVGEKGAERVTVTRAPAPAAGGGMTVTVSIGSIEYRGPGDIRETVKREVAEAFEQLAGELDLLPMAGVT